MHDNQRISTTSDAGPEKSKKIIMDALKLNSPEALYAVIMR
jgi:hypothetical protein